MNSQRKPFTENPKIDTNQDKKQKLNRKSTRSMSQKSNNMDRFIFDQNFEGAIQPPSPVPSSDQASSIQVKYLSYLAQVIDSAPEGSDCDLIQSHYHNAEYWHIVYSSAIYVKKDLYRTQIDDSLIMEEFDEYLKPNRIHPQANNAIGRQLLTNGYFLCAFAIALARKRKSVFIFRYLMQYFQNEFHLQTNQEELIYLLQNYVYNDRVEQILHLNLNYSRDNIMNEIQEQQKLTPGDGININMRRIQFDENNSSHEYSNRSKTVILDNDNSSLSFSHNQNH